MYVLIVLTVVSFFCYLDRFIIAVLAEPIKHDLGLNDTELGLLQGLAFAIFFAVMGMPLARLADTRSRPLVLSICLCLWSAATIISGFARNFTHLFLARIGVGVGEASCLPTSHSLLADYFPGERRLFAISVFQAGGMAGMAVGLAFAGYIADLYGWRAAFIIVGTPGVLLAALLLSTVRETRERSARDAPHFKVMGGLLARPAYRQLLIGFTIFSFASSSFLHWAAPFLMRSHGLTLTEVGAWTGISQGVGSILGMLAGGAVGAMLAKRDRRWEMWLPAIAFACGFPLFLGLLLLPDPLHGAACLLLATTLVQSGVVVVLSSVQSFAAPHERATAVAMVVLSVALVGAGLGPSTVGLLSDLFAPTSGADSLRHALLTVNFVLLWSVIHLLLGSRTMLRDKVD
jgi:predicted MFS family arabinose efflux permease